jgi:hypothetical protein
MTAAHHNDCGLSYMHSGMYALQESVRQMRGIAGAQISVCHRVGGMFAASGAHRHVERGALSSVIRCLEPEVCGISGRVIPSAGFGIGRPRGPV